MILAVQVLLGNLQGRAKRAFPVRFHGLRLVFINIFSFINLVIGLVAQWITRLTTDQKIPGSNPGKVAFFFFFSTPIGQRGKRKNDGQ